MDNFLDGMVSKFIVLKIEDIEKYLSDPEIVTLSNLIEKICDSRQKDGKGRTNRYLVANVDEPYAPEIVGILKRNGHWG